MGLDITVLTIFGGVLVLIFGGLHREGMTNLRRERKN